MKPNIKDLLDINILEKQLTDELKSLKKELGIKPTIMEILEEITLRELDEDVINDMFRVA